MFEFLFNWFMATVIGLMLLLLVSVIVYEHDLSEMEKKAYYIESTSSEVYAYSRRNPANKRMETKYKIKSYIGGNAIEIRISKAQYDIIESIQDIKLKIEVTDYIDENGEIYTSRYHIKGDDL